MKLAEDGIEVYEVAGHHNVIFAPAHVDALATKLTSCLARASDPAEKFQHDVVAAPKSGPHLKNLNATSRPSAATAPM
jgi:hypothetical protein